MDKKKLGINKRAKSHQTAAFDKEIEDVREAISWYFRNICEDKKPNKHIPNYQPLADSIPKLENGERITASYIRDIYCYPYRHTKRNIEKINAIMQFIDGVRQLKMKTESLVNSEDKVDSNWSDPETRNNDLADTDLQLPSSIEDNKYHFPLNSEDNEITTADAFRIFGAADENFSVDEIIIEWTLEPYTLPHEMEITKSSIIAREEKLAKETEADCHDGLNTRLRKYSFYDTDDIEQKSIKIELGPVRWYDYLVANKDFPERCNKLQRTDLSAYINELSKYIRLKRLTDSRIIDTDLTNIIDTATTIITQDGYVLYSKRSSRTGVAKDHFTAAVDENIHPILDGLSNEIDIGSSLRNVYKKGRIKKTDSKWAAMNPVFYTVIRGINEELSKKILSEFSYEEVVKYVRCLGMCFDLKTLHPDLLFIAILPMSCDDIFNKYKVSHGKDRHEGKLECCLLSDRKKLGRILREPKWTGGGKASLLRALEYLDDMDMDLLDNFDFNRVIF